MLKNYEFWSLGFALVSALIGFGLFCLKTFLPQKNNQINSISQIIIFSLISFGLLISLVLRGIILERFPCSNLYESLLIFSLSVGLISLFFISKNKWYFLDWSSCLLIIAVLAYALWLPSSQKEAIPLIPALNSYWRSIHVPALLISYAFFMVAGFIAALYLFKPSEFYSEAIYKCIAFGFPLLTFGIVTGALWANHAWGNLWQWDPKENLALMTWFCYAAYLHFKVSGKDSPKTLAWLSLLGIIAIYMTYLGINQFDLGGLHTYGRI